MAIVLVGIGGLFGAVVRYEIGKRLARLSRAHFPVATFFVNITGALLLGLLSGLDTPKSVYLLMGDGFLGAYTTFSTFMYEGFMLFDVNKKLNAAAYIVLSLILGLAGYFAGLQLGFLL